jgi:DNA-binding GntR family transcriptional regulator
LPISMAACRPRAASFPLLRAYCKTIARLSDNISAASRVNRAGARRGKGDMDRQTGETDEEGEPYPSPPAHGATVPFIVARLRDDILARRVSPGARLIESELTQRFSVSRGTVREALRRLNAEGLIEHWPHRGALVRRLSPREIRELFAIRVEMEALAARLAAADGSPDRRGRFIATIEPIFADAPRRTPAYFQENALFHDAIMALADNLELKSLAGRLQLPLIMAQVSDVLTADALEASVREHRAIAHAILHRDADAASARMREHLQRAAALALAGWAEADGSRLRR